MVTQSQKHYKTTVSLELNNTAWDDFLLSIDHGHHVQSSLWAEVKTSQGWQAATVTLNEADQIVAGAQLLYKPLPVKWMGCIGYIPKGPVFQHYSFEQLSRIIGEIKHLLKKLRIRHLIVQPNRGSTSDFSEDLCKLGFVESGMIFSPVATVVIDLSLELDEIFSRMKPKTRYNINKAERQGVLAKEGTIENLNDFHLLLQSTAKRQKFIAESEAFFNKLWQVFKPKNYIKLFITQADSVDLSAVLLVAFGDTVIYKRGGWFGRKKNLKPNEYMHWHAIKWAKEKGFKYYDFEGIKPEAANCALEDKPLPAELQNSVSRFKLGFGGTIVWNPKPYEYVPNSFLRLLYRNGIKFIQYNTTFKNFLNRMRT